jgi:hypothetical protein
MKKAVWVVLLLVIGCVCEATRDKLWEQGVKAQEDQAQAKANAMFDAAVKDAIKTTEDACYGEFIQVIVPPKNSTRQPVGGRVRNSDQGRRRR